MTDHEQMIKDYHMKQKIFNAVAFWRGMTPPGFLILIVLPAVATLVSFAVWLIS
jgi:hypothetical protein